MGLNVGEPDLEHRAQALFGAPLGGDRPGEAREVVAVALEQGEVEALLGAEVAVEDRLGDAGRGRDVVETSRVVAAGGEQAPGGLDDQRAAFLGGKPYARSGRAHVTDE